MPDPLTESENIGISEAVSATVPDSLDVLLDLGIPDHPTLSGKIRPLARELLLQLDPKDAAERMLAVQMIAAFSRSMYLSRYADKQKHPKWFALYSGECSRAMGMFRRQLQTFSDLRRPRRTTFTAIRQANIAGQQIVMADQPAVSFVEQPFPHPAPPSESTTPPPAPHGKSIQETKASLQSEQNRPCRPARQRDENPPLET